MYRYNLSLIRFTLIFLTYTLLPGCQSERESVHLLEQENLIAWCIVPFDSEERTPAERISMLQELDFAAYAYDWRGQHLDSFAEEIALARQADIDISAVWVWMNGNTDNPGQLSADNEKLLRIMAENELSTQIWLGFNDQMFDGLSEEEKLDKAAEMITLLQDKAGEQATKIGLYNHGGWFGDPRNQLKIIEKMNDPQLGIVYNFHHAHEQLEEFPQLLDIMQPYLLAVNLNGMHEEGPKILPIGKGNSEKQMIQELIQSGYKGPVGILGHVEDQDVALVLRRNLRGLDSLKQEIR